MKPFGATPMTVNGRPLNCTVWPMTDGSEPKRRSQQPWLRTATGWESGRLIFLRQKRAPERRLHAEHIEVIAGNEITPDALVPAAVAERADDDAIGAEAGEDGVAVAVILVVEIGLEGDVGAVVQRAVELPSCAGSCTGSGRRRTVSSRLKMEVFAPMPSAIEMMASAAKPGLREELANAEADVLQELFHRCGGRRALAPRERGYQSEMRDGGGLDSGIQGWRKRSSLAA